MSATVDRTDIHFEIVSLSVQAVDHPFESQPRASQTVLRVDGEACLVEGDEFPNESPSQSCRAPQRGSLITPAPAKGSFIRAGQSVLRVNGARVMTKDGTLRTCCQVLPEMPCSSAVEVNDAGRLQVDQASSLNAAPATSE